jgi:hypothetical protein
LAGLLTGLYIGKTYYSRTEVKEVEKEVVRTDVVTVVKTVERPDGTKETTATTTDKSVAKKDSSITSVTAVAKPDWHISISSSRSLSNVELIYGLQIERRILGPFSLGIRADTEKQIGLVIGMEF